MGLTTRALAATALLAPEGVIARDLLAAVLGLTGDLTQRLEEALAGLVVASLVVGEMGPPSQCSRRARTVRREPPAETPSGPPYGPRTRPTNFRGLALVGTSLR